MVPQWELALTPFASGRARWDYRFPAGNVRQTGWRQNSCLNCVGAGCLACFHLLVFGNNTSAIAAV